MYNEKCEKKQYNSKVFGCMKIGMATELAHENWILFADEGNLMYKVNNATGIAPAAYQDKTSAIAAARKFAMQFDQFPVDTVESGAEITRVYFSTKSGFPHSVTVEEICHDTIELISALYAEQLVKLGVVSLSQVEFFKRGMENREEIIFACDI